MPKVSNTTRLLTEDLWRRLAELASDEGPAFAAVAFFGVHGAELLPLNKGSRLVVNCSEAAVKAGQVNPSELLALLRRGVEIHSSPNLHAKVFASRSRAIVGSANVSEHSRNGLLEAAIETSDRAIVRACREFVRSLLGDELGEESLKKLVALYRPPKFPSGSRGRPESGKRRHAPAWVVGLIPEDWDRETSKLAGAERDEALTRIEDESAYRVDQFRWVGRLKREWKRGDRVIQVVKPARGPQEVWPPGRILGVRKYSTRRGVAYIISLELPKRKRARTLKDVRRITGNPAELKGSIGRRQLRRETILGTIAEIWNPK